MKKMLFLVTLILSGNTFGWEDNEDNRSHYRTIRSITLAIGALWSPSCDDSALADKAYDGFTTVVLNSVEDGQIEKDDALEMMTMALDELAEVAKRTDLPVDACQAARNIASRFAD
jgi:hypothetical protein